MSLTQYLVEQERKHGHIPVQLRLLIEVVTRACKRIAISVNKGVLGDVVGSGGSENVQGEAQMKLGVIANEVLVETDVQIPADTEEFAINMSNMLHWTPPVRRYIDECLAGREGVIHGSRNEAERVTGDHQPGS